MTVVSAVGAASRPRKASKDAKKKAHIFKVKKRALDDEQLAQLERAVENFDLDDGRIEFSSLPISDHTKRGLKKASFTKMTDIQTKSIPLALKGRDVLGAARTGSGKTLAFLVPLLEVLYRRKWGSQDGLGALVISPTRELAVQIFDVLRAIGGYHSFSAGLVIGGKNLKDERERLSRMNILVATPGRLLQHMDQTSGFECDNLQMLVLDEADRILDMGFAKSLNAIVGHLPSSRQTLLFSATQTQSVSDLARLSLKTPEFVGVREKDHEGSTPKNLQQHYIICELHRKLDVLFSFIKTHLQVKALVFMSCCKQVRFVFETFCKLHPGVPLLHIHGKQKQTKRLDIFQKFTTSKNAFLFATDIAARGLDFPSVDWVVQLDAPEDADTYIHRVGRTARYQSSGQSLLFLMPTEEEGMLAALSAKQIPIASIKFKESKINSIQTSLQNFAFQDPEFKYLGQRAFIAYLRSIYLQKDKSIFKVQELPVEEYATSLGLPGAPKIKFLGVKAKRAKNQNPVADVAETSIVSSDTEEDAEDDEPVAPKPPEKGQGVRTKYDKMFARKNQGILSEHYSKLLDRSDVADDDDEFITLKRTDHELDDDHDHLVDISKRKLRIGTSKKAMLRYKELGKHMRFDEEGIPHELYEMKDDEEFRNGDVMVAGQQFAAQERERLRDADLKDREVAKEKRKEKKRKRKEHELEMRRLPGDYGAVLAEPIDDDGYVSPDFDLPSADEATATVLPPPSKRRKRDQDVSLLEDEARAVILLNRK